MDIGKTFLIGKERYKLLLRGRDSDTLRDKVIIQGLSDKEIFSFWTRNKEDLFKPISEKAKNLPFLPGLPEKGIYEHYKGAYYNLLLYARDPEQGVETFVYQGLYSNEFGILPIWTRNRQTFQEPIYINGGKQQRYRFVKPLITKNSL